MPKPTFHNLPQAKRQRIIDAAVAEFSSVPYPKANLDQVVKAAGISKGSLYQYFGGKADLYAWLLTAYLPQKKMAAIGAQAPSPDASLWQVLEQAFVSGVRFAVAEPALTRLGIRFLRDHELEPALAEISRQHKAAADAWLMDLLATARSRGQLRADLDLSVAAGFLAHALGEGMLDQLARTLHIELHELLEQPDTLNTLTDDQLRKLVRSVTSLFRDGAGAP